MEQTHTTFITDHKRCVDITSMTEMATASTTGANFRLQTWAIFLSLYADRMTVTYTREKGVEVPDVLSHMQVAVSEQNKRTGVISTHLHPQEPMEAFEVEPALLGYRGLQTARKPRWSNSGRPSSRLASSGESCLQEGQSRFQSGSNA